jgi:hypothetical protein
MGMLASDTLFRSPGGGSDYGHLVQRITELKSRGCNLLVTGRVSDQETIHATRRFLGCPETTRKRLAVLIDGASSPADTRFPGEITSKNSDVSVLDYRGNRNGAVATTPGNTGPSLDNGDAATLPDIRQDICDEIQRIGTQHQLEPSELRVSIETLSGLFDRYPADEIRTFVRMITATVNEFSGMAHYHLPVPADSPVVEDLLPHVEVHVELRKRESLPLEHRWHLPDAEEKTDWYKLGE